MQWRTRRFMQKPHSAGEWDRWFAWYPVVVPTRESSASWVWLEVVERRWSKTRRQKRRYRLPDNSEPQADQRLDNLAELARRIAALSRSPSEPR